MDKKLKQKFWVEFIYGSSVVEGIKLTKAQVKDIVQNGVKSKYLKNNPSKHILQALGQRQVLEKIEKWAKLKKPETADRLREIHYLVFEKADGSAGRFRDFHIKLRSSALMPSFPFAISADMRDFNNRLVEAQKNLKKDDIEGIINLIAMSYHGITKIHPFADGNGRSARLFINLILRRYGLPYILVPKVDNEKYMREVLRAADMGDLKPLIKFQKKLLQKSLKLVASQGETLQG